MTSADTANTRLVQLRLPLSAAEATARLSTRVAVERSTVRFALGDWFGDWFGDWSRDYVAEVRGPSFRIRRAARLARPYAVRAYGLMRDTDGGCTVTVHVRRSRLATVVLWTFRIFILLLVGLAVVAAIRQPVFLVFGLFVAVCGGATL